MFFYYNNFINQGLFMYQSIKLLDSFLYFIWQPAYYLYEVYQIYLLEDYDHTILRKMS